MSRCDPITYILLTLPLLDFNLKSLISQQEDPRPPRENRYNDKQTAK